MATRLVRKSQYFHFQNTRGCEFFWFSVKKSEIQSKIVCLKNCVPAGVHFPSLEKLALAVREEAGVSRHNAVIFSDKFLYGCSHSDLRCYGNDLCCYGNGVVNISEPGLIMIMGVLGGGWGETKQSMIMTVVIMTIHNYQYSALN